MEDEQNPETVSASEEQVKPTPSVTLGDTVHYVAQSGQCHPATVYAHKDGKIHLVVHEVDALNNVFTRSWKDVEHMAEVVKQHVETNPQTGLSRFIHHFRPHTWHHAHEHQEPKKSTEQA